MTITRSRAKLLFLISILFELAGNFVLSYTDGFTVLLPTLGCILLYGISATLFGFSLKHLNLGIAFAVWSGVGILFLAAVDLFWFKQSLSRVDLIGIAAIVVGVVGMDLFGSAD